jgi:hypothetical protein
MPLVELRRVAQEMLLDEEEGKKSGFRSWTRRSQGSVTRRKIAMRPARKTQDIPPAPRKNEPEPPDTRREDDADEPLRQEASPERRKNRYSQPCGTPPGKEADPPDGRTDKEGQRHVEDVDPPMAAWKRQVVRTAAA